MMKVKDLMEPIKSWITPEMSVREAIQVMKSTAVAIDMRSIFRAEPAAMGLPYAVWPRCRSSWRVSSNPK